jgi:transposase InsO family protein
VPTFAARQSPRGLPDEQAALKCIYLAVMSLDPTGQGQCHLELATASWVHWFNTHRLHSMIGNVPPVEYEDKAAA